MQTHCFHYTIIQLESLLFLFSSLRLKNYSQYTYLQKKQCDICVNIAGITVSVCIRSSKTQSAAQP